MLLPFLVASLLSLQSQTGTIHGIVRAEGSREPIPGAAVTIAELARTVHADAHGFFVIAAVPAGRWRVEASALGHSSHAITVVTSAAAGVLLEDNALLEDAFGRYREVMAFQMNSGGQMLEELDRATSLTYSLSVLAAMLQVAEIARNNGEDLYGYQDARGRSLMRALEYHVAYVLRPDTWAYPQRRRFYGEYSGLFELAYAHWPQSSFATVIRRRGRPLELEVLGPVTLTHGRSLEPQSDARQPGHPAARAGRSAGRAPRGLRWE